MATKKRASTPKTPKDECKQFTVVPYKQFIVAPYKMDGNKLRVINFLSRGDSDSPIKSREDALAAAKDYLTRVRRGHNYYATGVLIFESVQIVKPKQVEVEIELITPV